MDVKGECGPGNGKYLVFFVGPQQAFNEMISHSVESRIGPGCRCIAASKLLPENQWSPEEIDSCLVMFDRFGKKPEDLWPIIPPYRTVASSRPYLSIYNIPIQLKGHIENESVQRGFRGVFFCDEPLEVLLKGIQGMLRGELWYSREVLGRCLFMTKDGYDSGDLINTLTRREREILYLLSAGCGNNDIADKLYVSRHTIKTHLYNIYKKIGVTNRLQAAMLARKYIDSLKQ